MTDLLVIAAHVVSRQLVSSSTRPAADDSIDDLLRRLQHLATPIA
jgi:hypothetical protein